jgi:peptide deformylase
MININEPLKIVAESQIPKAENMPIDNLMNIFRLCNKMEKICDENIGIGLSAVQIGIPWNLFIVKRGRSYEYYINCEYSGLGATRRSIEGCLSIKNEDGSMRRFEVERFEKIMLKGKQLRVSGTPSLVLDDINREENNLMAIVFQHEIDHGKQILISDIGKEIELME